jgi:5-methylthioribose kinase
MELKTEVAKLKLDFMNNAQALIHGDLHTGSIFIKPGSVKVIDPEFAFFGPIGYDVGNVIANLMFAWTRALVREPEDQKKHTEFLDWVKDTTKKTVDLFKEKFERIIGEKAQDLLFSLSEFQSWYVDSVMADTAGVTGLEINRRIIGIAKVKDITTLDDEKRYKAERILMESAKRFIVERSKYNSGLDYLETFEELADEIIGS